MIPRPNKQKIEYSLPSRSEKSYAKAENTWNEATRKWAFKKVHQTFSRNFSTIIYYAPEQRSTDLTWTNNEDRLNDLNNHINSKNVSKLDLEIRSKTPDWMNNYCYFNGIAQGSPLSPLLSTILLVHVIMLHPSVLSIFFADDGLLHSNKKFDPDKIFKGLVKGSGITAHPEGTKSGWVRKAGIWLKSLKFVGKIFVPESMESQSIGILGNATRTPKDFNFRTKLARIFGLAIEFDYWFNSISEDDYSKGKILDAPNPYGRNSMSELWKDSKYFGLISNRIYNGSMDKLPIEPEWKEYKFVVGSWSYYANRQWQGIRKRIPLISEGNFGNSKLPIISYLTPALVSRKRESKYNLFNASSFATRYLINYISKNNLNKSEFSNSCWKLKPSRNKKLLRSC